MRQICPQCQKMVELPDDATEANCPVCSAMVTIPQTYSVAVDPTAVKPVPPPVIPSPPIPSSTVPPPPSQPVSPPRIDPNRPAPPPGYALPTMPILPPSLGYTSSFPMILSATKLPWVIAGGFLLIFLLMVFPWSGSYPGGGSAYTQSYWGALSNSLTSDISFEQEFKQEKPLRDVLRSDWWILLPYLLTIVVGGILAWADRLVHAPDFAYRIGPLGTVRALIWPRRVVILVVIVVASLLLFSMASLRGFGLEAAVRTVATTRYADEKPDNTADRERVKAKIAIEQARFGLASGYAWWLVGLTHLTMAGAAGLNLWLEKRGAVPPPRFVAEW